MSQIAGFKVFKDCFNRQDVFPMAIERGRCKAREGNFFANLRDNAL